jgi:hypothetical protein
VQHDAAAGDASPKGRSPTIAQGGFQFISLDQFQRQPWTRPCATVADQRRSFGPTTLFLVRGKGRPRQPFHYRITFQDNAGAGDDFNHQ